MTFEELRRGGLAGVSTLWVLSGIFLLIEFWVYVYGIHSSDVNSGVFRNLRRGKAAF